MSDILAAMEWPHPVDYNKENQVDTDVLMVGGGIAGCHAAINAANRDHILMAFPHRSPMRSSSLVP